MKLGFIMKLVCIILNVKGRAGQTLTFLRLRASDAKAFCRRDGRRRDSDEKDSNANDATCHGRKISRMLKYKALAKEKSLNSMHLK